MTLDQAKDNYIEALQAEVKRLKELEGKIEDVREASKVIIEDLKLRLKRAHEKKKQDSKL